MPLHPRYIVGLASQRPSHGSDDGADRRGQPVTLTFRLRQSGAPYIPSQDRSIIISRRKFRGNIYTIPTIATDEADSRGYVLFVQLSSPGALYQSNRLCSHLTSLKNGRPAKLNTVRRICRHVSNR